MALTTARRRPPPSLRFSPRAWAKLLFLRDYGSTEVGAFGISPAHDLLYIEDVQLVRQACSPITVVFDDGAVADFFDEQVDAGRRPEQFARLWLHTHPGDCPQPSWTDETTFSRVFGQTDWAVMAIVACGGDCFARLRFNVGPGGEAELPVMIDYGQPFAGSDEPAWEAEYLAQVSAAQTPPLMDPWEEKMFYSPREGEFDEWEFDREFTGERRSVRAPAGPRPPRSP